MRKEQSLYFSDDFYRNIALNNKKIDYDTDLTASDAFQIVLKDLDYETINILCDELADELSLESSYIYDLIQKGLGDDSFKNLVLEKAYELIHSKKKLGNKIINGNYNASSWIVHSLYEAEIAGELASKMNLNPDVAIKLGLLHDIGRKFSHFHEHVLKGFEYLVFLGYLEEAFCCLTHSFLSTQQSGVYKGNRCATCAPAIDGFYVDNEGNGVFRENTKLDDIILFLNNYEYNSYDTILNIADLMATSVGIVSPYERLMDIYKRKKPDKANDSFFKVCLINALNKIMYDITGEDEYRQVLKANRINPEELDELLIKTSSTFMDMYNKEIKKSIFEQKK